MDDNIRKVIKAIAFFPVNIDDYHSINVEIYSLFYKLLIDLLKYKRKYCNSITMSLPKYTDNDKKIYTSRVATSTNPFLRRHHIAPTCSGILSGLKFGVKDNIAVKGEVTGNGNPDWSKTHYNETANAICVEQLLAAGARSIGKLHTSELTFCLDGENYFYGTPLNPQSPDRIPGGSSNGSASAVASKMIDFSLGTDNGGSIRIPAAHCGVYGMRPSFGVISNQGVIPFAPSFDTVGILATTAKILHKASSVLLAHDMLPYTGISNIYLLQEAFNLADEEVKDALAEPLKIIKEDIFPHCTTILSLKDIIGDHRGAQLTFWFDEIFKILQWSEIWGNLAPWISYYRPVLGPRTLTTLIKASAIDRTQISQARYLREKYFQLIKDFLKPKDIILIPTAPSLPPLKNTIGTDMLLESNYYPRTSAMTSFAGVAQLPQVSIPVGKSKNGIPVGLSILGSYRADSFLLGVTEYIDTHLRVLIKQNLTV